MARFVAVIGVLVALVMVPSLATAQAPGQSAPTPPQPMQAAAPDQGRHGFTIGAGLGHASFDAPDRDGQLEGPSFTFEIGGLLTPRFAIVGDLWVATHESDGDSYPRIRTQNTIVAIAAKGWLTPRFWLKGGIGRATYQIQSDQSELERDPVNAYIAAAGYEVIHSRSFALELVVRIARADGDNDDELETTALVLGLNWY